MRTKMIGAGLLLLLLSLCLAGCVGREEYLCELSVYAATWSGWEEGSSPVGEETVFSLRQGDSVDVGRLLDLQITVRSIREDRVFLRTSAPLWGSRDGSGGSLGETRTKFALEKGDTLTLQTPTEDAGDIYRIKIVDIYKEEQEEF